MVCVVHIPKPKGVAYHRQKYVVAAQSPFGDGFLVEVVPTVLSVHDAFGQAGGAGGGVDQEDVVRVEPGFGAQRPGFGVHIQRQCTSLMTQYQKGNGHLAPRLSMTCLAASLRCGSLIRMRGCERRNI